MTRRFAAVNGIFRGLAGSTLRFRTGISGSLVKARRALCPLIQQPLDSLRLARNDLQIRLGWPVRLRAALLSVPESAQGDVIADGELLLR